MSKKITRRSLIKSSSGLLVGSSLIGFINAPGKLFADETTDGEYTQEESTEDVFETTQMRFYLQDETHHTTTIKSGAAGFVSQESARLWGQSVANHFGDSNEAFGTLTNGASTYPAGATPANQIHLVVSKSTIGPSMEYFTVPVYTNTDTDRDWTVAVTANPNGSGYSFEITVKWTHNDYDEEGEDEC